jgi:transcriptional regulator
VTDLYPLLPFRIQRAETLCEIMRIYPLCTLISGVAGAANMTLLPMIIDDSQAGEIALLGHLDINNPHAATIVPSEPVSFQFLGADSYASPDLYPDAQLPGWLYVSVQGHGQVASLLDADELRDLLIHATQTFGVPDQRFTLDPADQRIDRFIGLIKGFRIRVDKISGIAKLAQDKGRRDSQLATEYLSSRDNSASVPLFKRILQESL